MASQSRGGYLQRLRQRMAHENVPPEYAKMLARRHWQFSLTAAGAGLLFLALGSRAASWYGKALAVIAIIVIGILAVRDVRSWRGLKRYRRKASD